MLKTSARLIHRLRRCRSGAVTVEFALTVIIFIFLVLFVAETARLAYISSVLDLATSEAAKEAKNAPADSGLQDYRTRFETRLLNQGGHLWSFLTRADATEINISFAPTIADMTASGGQTANVTNMPLARYQVKYHYHPMFFPFPGFWANNFLNREVIFVQEYERSKFMD
ncbi:pilus assembly protein [Escherichia alba]|jgi:tight adherence protein E|uniref:Pilus assembly protein n=1 Tax=Intestinirhabdus alba TaxID=2899544 RepID=A0A6L6IKK5_9ENTR|nr:TadE family protein [Intestinirhabdus alba]MTH45580.1 pilus assembly protein [Intestinirhabdus alba]